MCVCERVCVRVRGCGCVCGGTDLSTMDSSSCLSESSSVNGEQSGRLPLHRRADLSSLIQFLAGLQTHGYHPAAHTLIQLGRLNIVQPATRTGDGSPEVHVKLGDEPL